MSKRTFISFGLLVIVLAAVIPWLVFNDKGDAKSGAQAVPAHLEKGQELFKINCGNCHALYAAGTDGNYGPDLDELLSITATAPEGEAAESTIKSTTNQVMSAIENGVDGAAPGRMPPGILNEEQAEEVAIFVATTAGAG